MTCGDETTFPVLCRHRSSSSPGATCQTEPSFAPFLSLTSRALECRCLARRPCGYRPPLLQLCIPSASLGGTKPFSFRVKGIVSELLSTSQCHHCPLPSNSLRFFRHPSFPFLLLHYPSDMNNALVEFICNPETCYSTDEYKQTPLLVADFRIG